MHGESRALEPRRIGLFVLIAFGIAWITGGVIYATGGLVDSPTLVSTGGISLSLAGVLLPTAYMFAPAIGNVVTRLATGEGRANLLVRPRFTGSVRYYAAGWLVPAVLTVLGAGLFFAVFPQYFDASLSTFGRAVGDQLGQAIDPRTVAAVQIVGALTIAPVVNALFAFGEEFGWRAYLLPKLLPLGSRRAILVLGVVWGVWHWPVILMGYEYGFGYPGAPWTGLLVFPVFTITAGTFLAWLTIRTESVWAPALGHGSINAVAGIGLLFVRGSPPALLGPAPVGLLANVPWIVLAAVLLSRPSMLRAEPGSPFSASRDPTDTE